MHAMQAKNRTNRLRACAFIFALGSVVCFILMLWKAGKINDERDHRTASRNMDKPVRIAVEPEWPPWSYVLSANITAETRELLQGFHVDLARLVCKRADMTCEIELADAKHVFTTEQRLAQEMRWGHMDICLGWSGSPWRNNSAYFTETAWTPLLHSTFFVHERARHLVDYLRRDGTKATLPEGTRVGVQASWVASERCLIAYGFDISKLNITTAQSCKELVEHLESNTTDVIFTLLSDGKKNAPNACMGAEPYGNTGKEWSLPGHNGTPFIILNDDFVQVENCVSSGYSGAARKATKGSENIKDWEKGMKKLGESGDFAHLCKCWDVYANESLTASNELAEWAQGRLGDVCRNFESDDPQDVIGQDQLRRMDQHKTKDWCKARKDEKLELTCCTWLLREEVAATVA
eukprot:TRINITY_DN61548_c0_g3_i1.p1 TRINITY_DN61548_c0_g3~~TRINITY_DN61548_c0_g3_i1.p1  ORF type:complete len:407 (+),score=-11.32 TRINITY_DN61548_c0_g3_i1:64-1284(+)